MDIQRLIRSHYEKWQAKNQWVMPTFTDCLDFMVTEIAEAIDLRLRRYGLAYVRNNPIAGAAQSISFSDDIATEIFDAIMMGCIALDILGFDLEYVAKTKLAKMDAIRQEKLAA